ncbi:hypothetical protein [Candidatus Harpocratesius sp.]
MVSSPASSKILAILSASGPPKSFKTAFNVADSVFFFSVGIEGHLRKTV